MRLKLFTFLLLVSACLSNGYAQGGHSLELNADNQPVTIINGAVGGGTFTLPSGGGTLLTSAASNVIYPDVVTYRGVYNSGTAYAVNDLVRSSTPGVYFYSLSAGNTGNTPESSPGDWQGASLDQLNSIKKSLTLSSPGFTSLMSVGLAGTNTAGGRIQYMVRATDGGTQIATEEGVLQWLATANSVTCTVQATDKLHLGTVNSGCTPGFFNPNSQPGVSIFDNVSFSNPAPIVEHDVYFRIVSTPGENSPGSAAIIRLEP